MSPKTHRVRQVFYHSPRHEKDLLKEGLQWGG